MEKIHTFVKELSSHGGLFHDSNDKDEVHNARDEIAKVLTSLLFFPGSDHTNGYSIPKMHGMTNLVGNLNFWFRFLGPPL